MRRFVLFVLCLAVGSTVGLVGSLTSGSPWWYLAIPCAMAAGWLAVANPEQCLANQKRGQDGDSAV